MVVLPGPTCSPDLRGLLAGFVRRAGRFELLGAPIGGLAFCNQYSMERRVDPAQACLEALSQLPDPQTALLLLRYCSAYGKLSYAMRVTPPDAHTAALQEFDSRVRAALEQIGELQLGETAWRQASLRTAMGGLGLRSTALHATSAYVASVSSSTAACIALSSQYAPHLSRALAQ